MRNRKEPWSLIWSSVGFEAGQWPWGQQASISRTHEGRFRAALASAMTAFFMAWSEVSFWQSSCLAWVPMEGLRPLRNRRIKTGSEITASASNSRKTLYQCSRWAAQSITSSNWCWEFFLIVLQIILTKTLNSPRLCRKKALNTSQLLGTLVWSSILCWCCCHWNRAVFFKKVAANGTWFRPVALAVAKWSLHY